MRRNSVLVLGILGLALLSGCKPTFVTANTKVINSMPNRDLTVSLVQDKEDLHPAEKVKADQLRQGTFSFAAVDEKDFSLFGSPQGPFTVLLLAESNNGSGDTFPNPTEITIQTSGQQSPGQTITAGFAEIKFGAQGPVYTTNLADTFFEFGVADIFQREGDQTASGSFSLIARNKNDSSDARRLLVMDGAYIVRVKN